MVKCLLKYQWVKLPRDQVPPGKGLMGAWVRLASRAAFREGQAQYCGHTNDVSPGAWAGGMVGFKSILGVKRRGQALETAQRLSELGYIDFQLDPKTKKLTYRIKDWVVRCSGAPCMGDGAVYATPGYGFLCLPRNITQRLAEAHHQFDEADAWLDLWCHTVWQEPGNAFSHIAPAVQFGRYGAVLTLDTLGRRWGWEKTKVWRFLKKHADAFPLYKLPGAFGCLIFNTGYPAGVPSSFPDSVQIERILAEIRMWGGKRIFLKGSSHEQLGQWVAWYSRKVIPTLKDAPKEPECRVALSRCPIIRAYFSHCEYCGNFKEDCQSTEGWAANEIGASPRDGPEPVPDQDYGGIEYGRFEGVRLW